ncbi:MAG: hypothetical protein ACD_75C01937G0002 [uncultured bacterium]|nr:MAG: hypothetical protein ACD_75C01937G0002 [uncultured bacterium]
MVRDAAHGHLGRIAFLVSGCQRDAENFRSDHGIVKKHLVKIPHPVEKDGIFMLPLDFQVLLQHGGQFGHCIYLVHVSGRA